MWSKREVSEAGTPWLEVIEFVSSLVGRWCTVLIQCIDVLFIKFKKKYIYFYKFIFVILCTL